MVVECEACDKVRPVICPDVARANERDRFQFVIREVQGFERCRRAGRQTWRPTFGFQATFSRCRNTLQRMNPNFGPALEGCGQELRASRSVVVRSVRPLQCEAECTHTETLYFFFAVPQRFLRLNFYTRETKLQINKSGNFALFKFK